MPQLTPEQLAQVEDWAAAGASLNDIQARLKTEFDITLTYLDARLLMLDVGVRIKDKERPPAPVPAPEPAAPALPAEDETWDENFDDASAEPAPAGSVSLSADHIAIPGALISGKATFSDGIQVSWFLDQMGRLGLRDAPQGYQPPPADVPHFQRELDLLLQRSGY